MKFLRLSDDLLSVLFEDDDIVAIDKAYGYNAHTNDAKSEHGEAIQDGLIEIYEKHLGQKLHIIHRLDQTTTGVMIFGKSLEAQKKYADYFFNRQVRKTYWFVTLFGRSSSSVTVDNPIVHKGKELEAKTDFKLLKSENGFHLWQASPHTGRNHQIRIHAQEAGLSLWGDVKYGGQSNSFLCLHNHKIVFPNGVTIVSKPPRYFENLNWLRDSLISRVFFEVDRRERFFKTQSECQCFRLVHQVNSSKEAGFVLDQLGSFLILNWFADQWTAAHEKSWTLISAELKKPIWVQHRDSRFYLGAGDKSAAAWSAREGQTVYGLQSESLSSPGLYLNQRLQRRWLKLNAKGKSVLSLFSNTGGYGLAAALGEAKDVVLVEASKKQLAWSKDNFSKNGLTVDSYKFLCRDSLSFIDSRVGKGISFDIIALDVPTFFRREKGVFRVEKDLPKVIEQCVSLLSPTGTLLLSTQYDKFYIDDLRRMIVQVQKNLGIKNMLISLILPSLDFELPDEKSNLKSFLIQRA